MKNNPINMTVADAIRDLENHTLSGIAGEIARVVYLASTRDYNTGQYHHDGLAFRFSEEVAGAALATHHKTVFDSLALSSVETLVQELETYMTVSRVSSANFLELWKRLEPYRMTIPADCDELLAQLFFSNIKAALAILQSRHQAAPAD